MKLNLQQDVQDLLNKAHDRMNYILQKSPHKIDEFFFK